MKKRAPCSTTGAFDLRELLPEDFVPGLFILPVARSV